ncbi:MAG TPA: isoleucine--tRNA ligase [Candidatus Korarchaeota archaeon]|nr:isoleucine--tRNA ligase [Candidatus Korarchaeota archaeon]
MARVRLLANRQYDPTKFEEEILKFWLEERVYERIREMRKENKKFYFLDGPPYPSSEEPHPGTAWNKILKDVVIRYFRSIGMNVNDRPGWDTHGLPIEVLTEKNLGIGRKNEIKDFGVSEFIEKCKELASHNLKSMTETFKQLGVSMNWDNPYLTFENDYIESIWWSIKEIWNKGRIRLGLKVVHWCPRCETVLADYELNEYKELADPSIYVKFRILGDENQSILIWTTTPWTLPGNVAVMVNPDFQYAKVRVGNEYLIMAADLVEKVFEETGIEDYEIVETFPGSKLEGLKYEHPLADFIPVQREVEHKVVLSKEFVTLEEGTGCVHAAPGHGEEDFEVCYVGYKMPVLSPVDDQGVFTKDAGKYEGLEVRNANDIIISDLREKGSLLWSGKIVHKYPICWRCKTPLIMRATEQWFIKLEDLRSKLVEECMKAKWLPAWAGERRFKNWLMEARDWIISRQRFWGTPIPIWRCNSCGKLEVIGSKRQLEEKTGRTIKDLHKHVVDGLTWRCECGGVMKRIPDILDVWYDSGAAFYASLNFPKQEEALREWMPVNFVVEGLDQVPNGWFYSLLRLGVLLFNSIPYETVMVHGMMLDEQGREMHKSLGNFVPVIQIVSKYGRDAFRAFVISKTPWSDIRFSWRELENSFKKLNIIWNVYAFLGLYCSQNELEESFVLRNLDTLDPEDRWILSRAERVLMEVKNKMDELHIHEAFNQILDFIINDLSRLYIRLAREKLKSQDVRKLVGSLLYMILKRTLVMLAPFLPFISEKIYQESFRQDTDPESIHMIDWPESRPDLINDHLEAEMEAARSVLEAINIARASAKIKRRQPLRRALVSTANPTLKKALKEFPLLFRIGGNISEVKALTPDQKPEGKFSVVEFDKGTLYLDIEITQEELTAGLIADIRRRIQEMRKELGLRKGLEKIDCWILLDSTTRGMIEPKITSIIEDVDARQLKLVEDQKEVPEGCFFKEWDLDGRRILIWIQKVL